MSDASEFFVGGKAAQDELRRQMGNLLQLSNPAQDQSAAQRTRPPRVSMSTQQQRLKVADIPGYRLYWFKEENIPAAMDAYYEFVKRDELTTNPVGIGQNAMDSGNTDMGSNVSLVAGQNAAGAPARLVLMKLKEEYFREDQLMVAQRNAIPMEAIFGDEAKMFDKAGNIREADPLTYRKVALLNKPVRKTKPDQVKNLRKRLEALEKMVRNQGNDE